MYLARGFSVVQPSMNEMMGRRMVMIEDVRSNTVPLCTNSSRRRSNGGSGREGMCNTTQEVIQQQTITVLHGGEVGWREGEGGS